MNLRGGLYVIIFCLTEIAYKRSAVKKEKYLFILIVLVLTGTCADNNKCRNTGEKNNITVNRR